MKAKMLIALTAFFSLNAFSSELVGKNINGAYQWMGINHHNGWSPNYWDVSMRLPPASRIILGGAKLDKDTVELKNLEAANNSISINAKIVGMQYQLANGATKTSLDSGETTLINGNEVTVRTGEHKIGDKEVSFATNTQTPFTHFRPILNISEKDLAAIAEDTPSGSFEGKVNASMMYEYYRDGTRIRHYVPFPVSIKIEYQPDSQITVELLNSEADEIKPIYFLNEVSGETTYNLRVTKEGVGSSNDWFSMLLLSGASRNNNGNSEFYLKQQNPDPADEPFDIPFGIYCNECSTQWLVDLDGVRQVQKIEMGEKETSPYEFSLKVQFENAPLDKLNHGAYQGSFSVMFESLL